MGDVAQAYRVLEKHVDALALFEKQLEFFRRALPEDHPDTGERRDRSCAASFFVDCCGAIRVFTTMHRHGYGQCCFLLS